MANKAWRSAVDLQQREDPAAKLGRHAGSSIPRLPSLHNKSAFRSWKRRCLDMLVFHRESWLAISRKCYRSSCQHATNTAILSRRQAHREGDISQWLLYLVGPPQPTFPASLESPTARTASGKCYAAASYLQHKYGMLQAKPDLSHILHVHHDEAGRSRGALLPPDLLPQSVREVMFNTPSQAPPAPELLNGPLTPSERTKLWSGLRHGAPGKSQFKLALVPHLGTEAVAAAESLIEAMLRTGLAPRILKGAMLVWAGK